VSTGSAVEKRGQAKLASDALITVNGVTGVCVFGSVARGQADEDSDIDLLVLGVDPELKPSILYKSLPVSLRDGTIVLTYYTAEELSDYLHRFSRFGAHLKREGWVVHDADGQLTRILMQKRQIDTRQEVPRQLRLLRKLEHTDRFGGRFLFPLAHLYRIGRTVTYAQLAVQGILEFDQKAAFQLLSEIAPQWQGQLAVISRLAPFYARTRNRSAGQSFPFDPNGTEAEAEFLKAYDAVATIAREKA
jgi:nucleotidyltransferase-like protein